MRVCECEWKQEGVALVPNQETVNLSRIDYKELHGLWLPNPPLHPLVLIHYALKKKKATMPSFSINKGVVAIPQWLFPVRGCRLKILLFPYLLYI